MNLFDLTGKTALITGSTRGLGLTYARGLLEAGAQVVLNGTSDERLAAALGSLPTARGERFDVADEAQVQAAFGRLDQAGVEVDIVINNAGVQHRQPLVDLAVADWERILATHLTGAFLVAREAARRMIARGRGGKVINVGSLTSELARPTIGPYTAAKGGIKMLTRAMAAEWGPHNIQVNAIGPGYFQTDMNVALTSDPAFDAWVKASNPTGRWGRPEELVGAAVFLASNASSYMTGQILYVDGGWTAVL